MKVAKAIVDARREKIAQVLRKQRYLNLAELCSEFGISEATARRDMNALTRTGRIVRTHGGALDNYDMQFASLRERENTAYESKVAIAEAVLGKLKPNTVCFFDAGTTVLSVARQLIANPIENLTIVTNSLAITDLLSGVRTLQLYVIGGRVLDRQNAIFGRIACDALKQWNFQTALVGAWGIDASGIWHLHPELVEFQRLVWARSKHTYCCADATKIGKKTEALAGSWKSAPTLVTDATQETLQARDIPLKLAEQVGSVNFYA